MVTAVATESAPVQAREQSLRQSETVSLVRLQLPDCWDLTDERLLELCALNEDVWLEADSDGGLFIMPPPSPASARRELRIGSQILAWSDATGQGDTFPSATFRLPNGWRRAPDAAWVSDQRLDGIDTDHEKVWAVVPDLIVEIVSANDDLEDQRGKMEMWLGAGVRLGWLIDPSSSVAWIYRPQREPEQLDRPAELGGEDVAVGLTVSLARVWRGASEE